MLCTRITDFWPNYVVRPDKDTSWPDRDHLAGAQCLADTARTGQRQVSGQCSRCQASGDAHDQPKSLLSSPRACYFYFRWGLHQRFSSSS